MGLHLCYRLSLSGDTAVDDVRDKLLALKAFATTIGFDKVLGPAEYTVDDLMGGHDRDFVKMTASMLCADPPDFYSLPFGAPCLLALVVVPGEGSEPAIFAFLAPGARGGAGRADDLRPGDWFWSGACKTQYASAVSDAHFLHCHLGLIRVLEHAASLGVTVSVDDETGYWEHRSTERLLDAVRDMNRLVARFAGALDDRIGGEHRIEAPIFDHPEFEHLEMEDFGPRDQADGGDSEGQ